jgi:hypothetical protein
MSVAAATAEGGGGREEDDDISLGVIMTNTEIFHICKRYGKYGRKAS